MNKEKNMARIIDEFCGQENGYSRSITLRNKLIPIGKTADNLKQFLEKDQERADAYPEIKKLIDSEIAAQVNAKTGFKPFERICGFAILEKPFEVGVELSAKQEIMRYRLNDIYEKEIKSMFN